MEKQEYMKLIKEPWMRLKGDEGLLFKLIKEGSGKDIKPGIINKVIGRLSDPSHVRIE